MKRTFQVLLSLLVLMSGWAFAQDRLELDDGTVMEYYLALPEREAGGKGTWPLAILMGGGSGNRIIAYDVYRWLGRDLAQRGWAVASLVSPDNRSFRGGNAARVESAITELLQLDSVEGDKALLVGISNGGISALQIASREPAAYFGVVAVPAVVSAPGTLATLAGFPVYLRIGSEDQLGWADRFNQTVSLLTGLGVSLDAGLVEGGPHMFPMEWHSLDPWLQSLRPTQLE